MVSILYRGMGVLTAGGGQHASDIFVARILVFGQDFVGATAWAQDLFHQGDENVVTFRQGDTS